MPTFQDLLATSRILISDGATGTNLQDRGLPPGVLPEEWLIDRPDAILELERAFVQAGSDIILTCTFGGTGLRLQHSRYVQRTAEINRLAVELARQAASERPGVLVAGSIGPTGLMMQPFGELTPDAAEQTFAEQATALAAGGVDLLVIETFYALEEAEAAIRAAQRVCDLPIVCSFSYERRGRTMMGVRPAQVAERIASLGVAALGVNCGRTLEEAEQAIRELADQQTGLPLWAKPNAGLPVGEPPRYPVSPEEMAAFAPRLVAAGARIIGGCCGSTPAHIAALVHALRTDSR
jgi:5-methyltetrahydrofolate--homocysteine methyltransferase